jgi:hypothetical protein
VAIAVNVAVQSPFDSKKAQARVLVIASAQFLANPFERALATAPPDDSLQSDWRHQELGVLSEHYAREVLPSTIRALKNVLDWGVGDDNRACVLAPRSSGGQDG